MKHLMLGAAIAALTLPAFAQEATSVPESQMPLPAEDSAPVVEDAVPDAMHSAQGAEDTDPATAAEEDVATPDVNPPAISEANPGTLGSWVLERRIYTTNQPAGTELAEVAPDDVPPGWQQIAKVDDIVLDDSGQLVGYIADIGGFLGIGAKQVLLGADALQLTSFADDSVFATNLTKEELEALPDFNKSTVRD